MVGVAFIHLLAEATHALPEVYPDYEALPFTLACSGIVFVLVIENVLLALMKPASNDKASAVGQDTGTASAVENFHQKDASPPPADSHLLSHTNVKMIADSKSFVALIKAYMMEIAIAIHSIIIGVSMGMMGPDEISSLRAIIIAIVFHQFFEGIGLGAVLSYVRLSLGDFKILIFAIIFGATISIGIGIGMYVSFLDEVDDYTHEFVTGSAHAISAGILIYVAMVEMMADEFSNHEISMKTTQKFTMIGSFSFGVFIMAILAMWA
eukprot:CAMPEP_0182423018 /NCGR_PEP_ID=MMETSP1167-20130531/8901_1 /TAXON_ID=2988 /ORGANISM="Mallomonas Sp, Strain CCMP3275" /LENGTH=265 /DNA_ID=CAMNT_0024601595 /DNA_START=215 /DNA_END=1012 /DNA_ORIENTATION=+